MHLEETFDLLNHGQKVTAFYVLGEACMDWQTARGARSGQQATR